MILGGGIVEVTHSHCACLLSVAGGCVLMWVWIRLLACVNVLLGNMSPAYVCVCVFVSFLSLCLCLFCDLPRVCIPLCLSLLVCMHVCVCTVMYTCMQMNFNVAGNNAMQEILKNTPPSFKDYEDSKEAIELLKQANNYLNESRRELESHRRIEELSELFSDTVLQVRACCPLDGTFSTGCTIGAPFPSWKKRPFCVYVYVCRQICVYVCCDGVRWYVFMYVVIVCMHEEVKECLYECCDGMYVCML